MHIQPVDHKACHQALAIFYQEVEPKQSCLTGALAALNGIHRFCFKEPPTTAQYDTIYMPYNLRHTKYRLEQRSIRQVTDHSNIWVLRYPTYEIRARTSAPHAQGVEANDSSKVYITQIQLLSPDRLQATLLSWMNVPASSQKMCCRFLMCFTHQKSFP